MRMPGFTADAAISRGERMFRSNAPRVSGSSARGAVMLAQVGCDAGVPCRRGLFVVTVVCLRRRASLARGRAFTTVL
jgi:hypothetical protein